MAEDHYETLGVSRSASEDEIRQAYRKLAREHHPDLNQDDPKAKENFQRVQNAFDVLNDAKKREMYDRYGSAYESMGAGGGPGGPGGPGPWSHGAGGQGFDVNLDDILGGGGGSFADIFKQFGQRGGRQRRNAPTPGRDLEHELTVPFASAVLGGGAEIAVRRADGREENIHVKIPPGIESGKKIRLRGQGEDGMNGAPAGDMLIRVNVAPHPCFRRNGLNLETTVQITLAEALAGAKIDLPTPHGAISLSVPSGTSGGKRLRVKGHGIRLPSGREGDLFAEIQIMIPHNMSAEDTENLASVARKYSNNPREQLQW